MVIFGWAVLWGFSTKANKINITFGKPLFSERGFTFGILRYVCLVFEKTIAFVLPPLTFSAILRRFLARFYFVSVLNAFGICEETKTIVNEMNYILRKRKKRVKTKNLRKQRVLQTKHNLDSD